MLTTNHKNVKSNDNGVQLGKLPKNAVPLESSVVFFFLGGGVLGEVGPLIEPYRQGQSPWKAQRAPKPPRMIKILPNHSKVAKKTPFLTPAHTVRKC